MPEAAQTTGSPGVAAVGALLVVPVTVLSNGTTSFTLVFLWSLVNTAPGAPSQTFHLFTIGEYFAAATMSFDRLPPSLQAWPLSLGLHVLAVGSASAGWLFGREDRRVTGGLLVLAGGASLWVALGLGGRIGATVGVDPMIVPVGAIFTWVTVILLYRDDLWSLVGR